MTRRPRLPRRSPDRSRRGRTPARGARSRAVSARFGDLEVARAASTSTVAPRRGRRRSSGPSGLRQVDAAGADRRASLSRTRGGSPSAAAATPRERLARCAYMPQRDLLLPWLRGDRQRRARAAQPRALAGRGPRARPRRCFERFGLAGFERARPARALGRDAPARRLPAHAAGRQAGAAARRAVRRRSTRSRAARCRSGSRDALARPSRATVLLVTHDVEEALYLSDRVAVLSRAPGAGAREIASPCPRAARPRGRRGHLPRVHRRPRARAGGARGGTRDESAALAAAGARARRPARRLGARRALGRARRRARHRAVPDPGAERVAEALWEDRALLAENAWVTLQEVLLGFAIALVLGLALRRRAAPLRHRCAAPSTRCWSPRRRSRSSSIAPILVVWFGFGIGPKLAIIALICFFPITVNTLDGLRSVDPELRKMMRTLDAGRWQTLRRVEAPAALPYCFSGAKIAVAVAVIGAVFGEWAGADEGLGHLILHRPRPAADRARVRGVVVLSAFAIALFGAARAARAAARVVGGREPAEARRRGGPCIAARASALAAIAAGCGEKEETARTASPSRFDLALDFYVNPDHAGIYTALERGYFERGRARRRARGCPPTPRRRSSRSPRGRPTSRSPTSPRCCSPATRASPWSPSRRSSTSR